MKHKCESFEVATYTGLHAEGWNPHNFSSRTLERRAGLQKSSQEIWTV